MGMRHTSTALYFYGASEKSLHKHQAIFGNMLLQINYDFNYYLKLLCFKFKYMYIYKNVPPQNKS
jgi:hypothetical protein